MEDEKVLVLDAYIPSLTEYKNFGRKFPAFLSAKPSKEAIKKGVWQSSVYDGNGYYPLRTLAYSSNFYFCDKNGSYNLTLPSYDPMNSGVRIAFQIKYSPDLKILSTLKKTTKSSKIYNEESKQDEFYTGVAPVIEFGGNKFIWLNKEKCENYEQENMILWSLELLEKTKPFNDKYIVKDYAFASNLLKQCSDVLKRNCTPEELKMIVEVKLSSKDNYEKAIPFIKENFNNYDEENNI